MSKEVELDDIPIERDYIDEVKSELSYTKKFRKMGSSVNLRRRIRKQISNLINNKISDPKKYQRLNQDRAAKYRKMRDLEYEFMQLSEDVQDIEQDLIESWKTEDEEDIFNEE